MWCDIETTGLEPEKDFILEICLVLTTLELEAIDWRNFILRPELDFNKIKSEVIDMHTANGLWIDVINIGAPLSKVNMDISFWLDKLIPRVTDRYEKRDLSKVYLAGSSVHFDRSFMKKYKFSFEKEISYRHLDISVVRTMLKMWKPEDLWPQISTHRAKDDIFDHIEEAKFYRNVLGLWNPIAPESKGV